MNETTTAGGSQTVEVLGVVSGVLATIAILALVAYAIWTIHVSNRPVEDG